MLILAAHSALAFSLAPGCSRTARPSCAATMVAAVLPTPPQPKALTNRWEVHKFGGASLATADLYRECSDLLVAESTREKTGIPTMAIVSAKGGVTDRLIETLNAAIDDIDEAARLLKAVADEQIEVVHALASSAVEAEVAAQIRADEEDIINVLRSASLIRQVPPEAVDLVTGFGEVWSARTMHAYLKSEGIPTACLDAREVVIVEQTGVGGLGEKGSANVAGTDPLWDVSAERLVEWFARPENEVLLSNSDPDAVPVVVVTGFVAATLEGSPTTLKRSGSDYSATIFAKLFGGFI